MNMRRGKGVLERGFGRSVLQFGMVSEGRMCSLAFDFVME